MNIQFMTEKNAKIIKDPWTGEDKTVYVPDFEELVKNASCQEEIDAIRETEAMLNNEKSCFKGFFFQIVHMVYAKVLEYDSRTHKQEWVEKWQMYQHPWIRDYNGVYKTKEEMIHQIETMNL